MNPRGLQALQNLVRQLSGGRTAEFPLACGLHSTNKIYRIVGIRQVRSPRRQFMICVSSCSLQCPLSWSAAPFVTAQLAQDCVTCGSRAMGVEETFQRRLAQGLARASRSSIARSARRQGKRQRNSRSSKHRLLRADASYLLLLLLARVLPRSSKISRRRGNYRMRL